MRQRFANKLLLGSVLMLAAPLARWIANSMTARGVLLRIMRAAVDRAAAAVLLLFLGMSGAAVADTVTASPTACTSVAGIGTVAWTNPDRAVSSNDSDATASVDDGQTTNYLRCVGYGFAIPAGATINGITVSVERSSSDTGTQDAAMRIVKAGAIGATDRSTATAYPATDTYEAHGGATDLWGTTWTPADINDANFGAAFASRKPGSFRGRRTISVDHIQITVDYSLPPPPFSCAPPANTPAELSLTCVCDTFGRATLNPSTIFGSNWLATSSDSTGILPRIVNPGYLRLTENTGNNAKAVTVPGIFPAAGNYISVEFRHYAYNGTNPGADGIAVTLSDYAVPPAPGAYGGSLGYAQKTGIDGFAGGWVGVAMDEWGNYQNPTEGRIGGPGFIPQSVGVRGSGSGTTGYRWMAGTAGLSPGIDNPTSTTPARGYYYQVIVDARGYTPGVGGTANIAVNRDTSGSGGSYANLIGPFDAYAAATAQGFTQAAVPDNWQISFTGSTGGSTNIHEIGGLRICAQTVYPTSGGTPSGFNAIDEAYAKSAANALQGHLYTKLAGTPFTMKVAALADGNGDGVADGIQTSYVVSGSKNVLLQLIDDSAGPSCNASAAACSGCSKPVVASQTLNFVAADQGFKQSGNFTLDSAYSRLIARMCQGGSCPANVMGCSVDAFAVRPASFSAVTSTASNAALSGTPKFKAGTDAFTLAVTTDAPGYTGIAKINTTAMLANGAGWTVGAFTPSSFPAAVSGPSSSTASASFTYAEVGNFRFRGYDPLSDTASARGIYDDSWTLVDQGVQNDCVANSYRNTKDASGKYGCLFGLYNPSAPDAPDSPMFGRFVPDHFTLLSGSVGEFCAGLTRKFSYMGQPKLRLAYALEARNGVNGVTGNYSAALTPAYPVTNPLLVAEDQAGANQGCDLGPRVTGLPPAAWSAGAYSVPATDTRFSRPAAPGVLNPADCAATRSNAGGPFWQLDIGVNMTDADAGAAIAAADMNADTTGTCSGSGCTAKRLGTTGAVFGRLTLGNAYGSELLPLPLPLRVQYWSGAGFADNGEDICTRINASDIAFNFPAVTGNNLSACETRANLPALGATAPFNANTFGLTAPGTGNNGWVDLTVNLGATAAGNTCTGATATPATTAGMPWLQGNWGGAAAYNVNPTGRARFGAYRGSDRVIYFREIY